MGTAVLLIETSMKIGDNADTRQAKATFDHLHAWFNNVISLGPY